jgi:hypothetical protein
MSQTAAVPSPRDHRLPGRLIAIAVGVVLVIVTVITIALLVAASSGDGGAPSTTVPIEKPQPTQLQNGCVRFPVNTPC